MGEAFIFQRGSGGSLTKSILIVTAPTGSTVTVTKGATTKTAMEKNGEWWFKGLENGEWTIRAELDGQSATEVINITQFGVYRKPISYRMTPEFTYTGDYEIVQDDDTPIEDFASWKGNWKIRLLTSSDFTITKMHGFAGKIDVFLVGGGASGGGRGGGGSGYTKTLKAILLNVGVRYQIVVGAGGEGLITSGRFPPKAGGVTSAFDSVANGGNAGSSGDFPSSGGSGGGDGTVGGAGKPGGSNGSDGGGGSGKGQGTTTREFGEPGGKLYAGGGAGAGVTTHQSSSGGDGGGGMGGGVNGDPMPKNGDVNTGGGGGGIGNLSSTKTYASGGSGIVIIRNAREVAQ